MKEVLILIITISLIACVNPKTDYKTSQSIDSDSIIALDNNEVVNSEEKSNNENKDECEIGYLDESFKLTYYPFNFEYFSSQKILSYFNSNVIVDSIEKTGHGDYKYRIYKYKDSSSFIEFMVKSYEPNNRWFYIEKGEILSNLFDSKNGIRIDMNKSDFAKVLGVKEFECDTFEIIDGELATHYMCHFTNNHLKKINIYSE